MAAVKRQGVGTDKLLSLSSPCTNVRAKHFLFSWVDDVAGLNRHISHRADF